MRNARMTTVAFLAILALVPCWIVAQETRPAAGAASALEDTKENRLAMAERCLHCAPTKVVARMACGRVASVRADIAKDQLEKFLDAMMAEIDLDMMTAKRKEIMAKHFTAEELRALAQFYESPSGRSAWDKLGAYVVDMQGEMKAKVLEAETRARKAIGLPVVD
jgi:hypothetical protein